MTKETHCTPGAILWLAGVPIPALVPGMAAFLILAIAGERLALR